MYSRGYDRGIESDGTLMELERSFEQSHTPPQPPPCEEPPHPTEERSRKRLFGRLDTEDLLIIAIAILILLDGEPDNDLILIALAVLFFF